MIRRSLEMRLRKLERRGPALRRQGQRPFPDWLQRALEAQGYHFDSEGRIDWRATPARQARRYRQGWPADRGAEG
jgi:hypothetical protein